jgi:hypothetical protein
MQNKYTMFEESFQHKLKHNKKNHHIDALVVLTRCGTYIMLFTGVGYLPTSSYSLAVCSTIGSKLQRPTSLVVYPPPRLWERAVVA